MYELEVIDMGKKEEQAREYAKSRYGNNGYETGNEIAKVQACTVGYIAGWDEALKSQWVNVKEQQPAANELVLCRMVSNEAIVSGYIYSEGGKWRVATLPNFEFEDYGGYECDYWMPIPSFEDILEANKDVLKRLKYK